MNFNTLVENEKFEASIEKIHIIDRQGSQSDELKIEILNGDYKNIERGRNIEGIFGGFKSGKMHIDKISSSIKKTQIGAISAPVSAKEKHTRHWRKVRLFDIVNDVATNLTLSVFYYGVQNFFYENVTQFNETDLAFLNRLCIREGILLKIDNERIVMYDKATVEKADSVLTIKSIGDVINENIAFSENPNMVHSVTVKYFADRLISYTATSGTLGAKITLREYVSSEAEAERFAKAYLSHFTQNDITLDVLIPINDGITSGNCIGIENFARYSGKYFVFECYHDPKKEQTRLLGRRIKE